MAQKQLLCQCDPHCKEPPLVDSPFCQKHKVNCPRQSPVTGWEPKYQPSRWSDNYKIRKTHNCFSYAMNIQDPRQINACADEKCTVPYPQPGSAALFPGFTDNKLKSCPEMKLRIRGENPSITPTTFEAKCPPGTSKIFLAVDPKEDYHFWRMDRKKSGETYAYWSGKPGSLPVTDKDASGKRIYDPSLCDRDYTDGNSVLNYKNPCGFYCVPRNKPLYMKTGGSKGAAAVRPSRRSKPRWSVTRRFQGHIGSKTRRNRTVQKERREASDEE